MSDADRLNLAARIAEDFANGDISRLTALRYLQGAGLNPNIEALDDAQTAIARRNAFLSGELDPFDFHDIKPGHPHGDVVNWAAEEQEQVLRDAVTVLARPFYGTSVGAA